MPQLQTVVWSENIFLVKSRYSVCFGFESQFSITYLCINFYERQMTSNFIRHPANFENKGAFSSKFRVLRAQKWCYVLSPRFFLRQSFPPVFSSPVFSPTFFPARSFPAGFSPLSLFHYCSFPVIFLTANF